MKRRKNNQINDLTIAASSIVIKLMIIAANIVSAKTQQHNPSLFNSQRLTLQATNQIPSYHLGSAFTASAPAHLSVTQQQYPVSDLQYNDNFEASRESATSDMVGPSSEINVYEERTINTVRLEPGQDGQVTKLQHPTSNNHQSRSLESSSSNHNENVNNDSANIDGESSDNMQSEQEGSADQSHETPERNLFMDHHNSQLQAMHDLFERRQLSHHHQQQHQIPSSQELNPIAIGLDPGGPPFSMPPFQVPNHNNQPVVPPHPKPMANADNVDQGLGPSLPFGLNPLPHLLGFNSPPSFDGPQRGDQSTHSNIHSPMPAPESTDGSAGVQKVWPKIFRFTDGRINLSEFEKQKKIRLSNKNQHNGENHIESAPIMFDGRQLKRKSFLILHGGIFSA